MVHISWLRMLYQVALFPEETWQPLKTPNLGSGSNAQATRVGAWQWRHNLWKGKVKRIQRRVSVLLFRYLQKMYWFFRRCLEWRNTLAEIYSTFLLTWTKTCYLQGENCIFFPRKVTSVGRMPVCWVGGREFKPRPDQHLGSLNN